MILSDALI